MANRADIVIGANFGDEGKGLVTDYLASKHREHTLVVRHNGGAQAGHTVTTPDGKRHVFKHFSSGSLVGAQTLLSRFYVCNPILYFKELEALRALGVDPLVYVDPAAPVSTYIDMMLNQFIEEHRGNARHGSCGVGFGETLERHLRPACRLCFRDLGKSDLKDHLRKIREKWLPKRLAMLGIETLPPIWKERFYSDHILDWYAAMAQDFSAAARTAPKDLLQSSCALVFEGAQGLLLDQDHGWFPHVTRSSTGIKNALMLLDEAGIEKIDVTYITRAYNTRHGAGPLPYELSHKPYAGIVDETNIHNEYQGSLRYAHLDVDLLAQTIQRDLGYAKGLHGLTYRLAVTCLDQIDDNFSCISQGIRKFIHEEMFLKVLSDSVGVNRLLTSRGPTRRTIKEVEKMHAL